MATLRAAIDASGAVIGARTFAVAIDQMRRAVLGISLDTTKFATASAALQTQIAGVKNLAFGFFGAFTGFTLLKDAANSIASFDQELRTLAAIGQVPVGSEQFERIRESALDLAGDTRFSVNEVLDGLTELTKAGFTTGEALQSIRPVLDLATLGNLNLARAVDIVVSSLSQFGLDADQAGRITDVLALTAQETITDVDQLGEALRVIGPIASNLGLSFEDIVSILGVVSQAGTKASLAGTQLRSVFASLATPTDKAAEKLLKFNISTEQLSKIFEAGGAELFQRLRGGALSTAEAFEVFDNRGATVALSASRMADEITRLIEANKGAEGSSRKTADEINKGLSNSFNRAAAAADAFFKRIVQDAGINNAIGSLTNSFTQLFDQIGKSPETVALVASSFKFLATSIAAITTIRLTAWLIEATRGAFALRAAVVAIDFIGPVQQVTFFTAALQRLKLAFVTAPVLSWATAIGIAATAIISFGPHLAKRTEDLERFKDKLLSFRDVTELFERGFQLQLEGSKLSDRTKQLEGIENQTRAVEEALTRARVQLGLFSKGVVAEAPVLPVSDLRGILPSSDIDTIAQEYKIKIREAISGVLDGSIKPEDAKKSLDEALEFFKQEKIELPFGLKLNTGTVDAIQRSFEVATDSLLRVFASDKTILSSLDNQISQLRPVAIPVDDRSLSLLQTRLVQLNEVAQRIRDLPVAETFVSTEKPPNIEFLEEQRRLQEDLIRQNVRFSGTFDAQRKQIIAQSVAYFNLNEQKVLDDKITESEADKLNLLETEVQRVSLAIVDLAQRKEELQQTRSFEDEEFRLIRQTIESRDQLSTSIDTQIQALNLESEAYSKLISRRLEDGELNQTQASRLSSLRQEFDSVSRSIIEQVEARELLKRQRSFEDEETSLITRAAENRSQLTKTIEDQISIINLESEAYDRSIQRRLQNNELTQVQADRLKELGDQATNTAIELAKVNESKRLEEESFKQFKSDSKISISVAQGALSDFSRGIGAAAAQFTTLQEAADQALRNIIAGFISAAVEAALFQNLIKPLFVSSFGVSPESVDKAFGRSAKGSVFTSKGTDIERFARGGVFYSAFSEGGSFTGNTGYHSNQKTLAFSHGGEFYNTSKDVRAFALGDSFSVHAFAHGANSQETNQLVSNVSNKDVRAFATGNPFSNSVVTRATIAPLALFGEKTPEAIVALRGGSFGLGAIGFLNGREIGSVPLTRGSGGRLGIDLNKLPSLPEKETKAFSQGGTFVQNDYSAFADGDVFTNHSNIAAFKNGGTFTSNSRGDSYSVLSRGGISSKSSSISAFAGGGIFSNANYQSSLVSTAPFAAGGVFSKENITREISRRTAFERVLSNVRNTLSIDSKTLEREVRPLRFGESNIKLPSISDGGNTTNIQSRDQRQNSDSRDQSVRTVNNNFGPIRIPSSDRSIRDRVRRTQRQIDGLLRSGRRVD